MKLGPTKEVGLNSSICAFLNVPENDVMGGAVIKYPRIKKHIPAINVQLCEKFNICFLLSVTVYSCCSLLFCLNHWKFGIFCITFHRIFRNLEIF